MKTIALYGKSNCGKTSALKAVYKKIKEDNAKEIYFKDYEQGDITAVFKYKGKYIGFTTYGDNDITLKEPLEQICGYDCDICIAASRTSGSSVEEIRKIESDNLIWLKKADLGYIGDICPTTEEYDAVNEIQARMIFEQIQKLLSSDN